MHLRGLTDEEYEAIQAAAKAELPFRVTIRRHREKRSHNTIDIRPLKTDTRNGLVRYWSDEQTYAVYEFVQRHQLHPVYADCPDNLVGIVFSAGFSYLRKVIE